MNKIEKVLAISELPGWWVLLRCVILPFDNFVLQCDNCCGRKTLCGL